MKAAPVVSLSDASITEVELVRSIFTDMDILQSFLTECKLNLDLLDTSSITLEERGDFTKRADACFNYDGNKFIFECMSSKSYLDEDHIARALLYCIRTNAHDLIILCEDVRDNVERVILDNIPDYNIRFTLVKYRIVQDMIVFTRVISPKEYSDNYKVEKKKYITEDIVSVFSGKLPMDIQGTRSTTVNNELVQLTLTGTILESGNILVHETGREYESLSAACMDGLKHVSNGVEIQISGWRFWKDSRGESLYKYKEQASSVINTEQGSKDQEV